MNAGGGEEEGVHHSRAASWATTPPLSTFGCHRLPRDLHRDKRISPVARKRQRAQLAAWLRCAGAGAARPVRARLSSLRTRRLSSRVYFVYMAAHCRRYRCRRHHRHRRRHHHHQSTREHRVDNLLLYWVLRTNRPAGGISAPGNGGGEGHGDWRDRRGD